MRCHDICPKTDIDTLLDTVKENGIWHLGNPFLGLILDRDIIHRDLPI